MVWGGFFQEVGGLLRGHWSGGPEGNVERAVGGFGYLEDGGICMHSTGFICGINCSLKWVLDENVRVRW